MTFLLFCGIVNHTILKNAMESLNIQLNKRSDEPLHIQLAAALQRHVLNSSLQIRHLPSERSLCDQLNLNRSTVHRAYESLRQKGVVRPCSNRRLEIVPGARRILAGAFPSIGVLLPEIFSSYVERSSGAAFRYLKGIFDRAAEMGCSVYMLQIPPVETPEAEVLSFIESNFQKLIGIIHLGGRSQSADPPLEMVFQRKELPQIFISGISNYPHIGSIYTDFSAAARSLASHLMERGCRTLSVVSYVDRDQAPYDYVSRYRAETMKNIFASAGMKINEEWNVDFERTESVSDVLEEKFRKMAADTLPDFFWCLNDEIALQTIAFCRSRNLRVPEDIQIAGFDGLFSDGELSTVAQQFQQLGAGAVDLLLEYFEHGIDDKNRIRTIEAELIPGKTIKG